MRGLRDPETAAWLIAALTLGIGTKQAAGQPAPDRTRLANALMAMFGGLPPA